jgi:hypothetical protein
VSPASNLGHQLSVDVPDNSSDLLHWRHARPTVAPSASIAEPQAMLQLIVAVLPRLITWLITRKATEDPTAHLKMPAHFIVINSVVMLLPPNPPTTTAPRPTQDVHQQHYETSPPSLPTPFFETPDHLVRALNAPLKLTLVGVEEALHSKRLAGAMNGQARPRGSYTEATVLRMPLLVSGLSLYVCHLYAVE